MMKNETPKFRKTYRIPSARAQWWNYAASGAYFITICTAGRAHLFGEIRNNTMILSEIGNIVAQEWNASFDIRTELFCDAFVIMPNHIHAILRIDHSGDTTVETHGHPVETHGRASLQPGNHGVAYRPPKSISSFVAGFKSAATKRINAFRNTPKMPVWQTRFHDHIIRNEDEYQRIWQYIETNPAQWEQDTLFRN
jgi:REP element-mobilizing transposase RayT